jgi:putative ABC transport system ATP-binding protein
VVYIDHLNHWYGEGDARNQVLFENSIEIGAGQFVVVTGPSGSGKTTLLSLIGALRSVQEGTIQLLGRNLTGLVRHELVAVRRNIGFIFQSHNLFASLSAYENVMMAMYLGSCPLTEMRERGLSILSRLGLAHRADYKPRALSGGQAQRVAVARALVNEPELILADEPTAALDKESSANVVNLLKELTVQQACTVIMVTHDNRILELTDRIVNMVDGRIVSDVVVRDAVVICEMLRGMDLFQHLTPVEITNIAERMKRRRFGKDDIIIGTGDIGEEFFLIVDGAVDVFRPEEGIEKRPIARLTTGQFFGEQSLITGESRNATCVAATEVEVFALDKIDFKRALETTPSFHDQILSTYFQRQ